MKREDGLRGLANEHTHVRPINFSESPESDAHPALDHMLQKMILYYSDFDVDVNDWKAEQQSLSIFGKNLLTNLSIPLRHIIFVADSWVSVTNLAVNKDKSKEKSATVPERSAWEVGLEYAYLTMNSEKVMAPNQPRRIPRRVLRSCLHITSSMGSTFWTRCASRT